MPILKPNSSEGEIDSYTIPDGHFMVDLVINVTIFVPRDETKPIPNMSISPENPPAERYRDGYKKIAKIVEEIEETGRFPTEKCLHTELQVSCHNFIRQYVTNKKGEE